MATTGGAGFALKKSEFRTSKTSMSSSDIRSPLASSGSESRLQVPINKSLLYVPCMPNTRYSMVSARGTKRLKSPQSRW